jgi:hypothetical protein
MKKVIVTVRGLDVFGGTEIQTFNLCKALVELNYEVILLSFFLKKDRVGYKFTEI